MKEETITDDDDGRRLDRVLRKAYPDVPPGAIAGAVRRGAIRINGNRAKNETRVTAGDRISIPDWHDTGHAERRTEHSTGTPSARLEGDTIVAGEWQIPIIDRSDDWIVVNKPSGIASHGKNGLDAIIRSIAAREGWWSDSLSFRPGPVHRLDQNTSGVQLFSLTTHGAQTLTEQIRTRLVSKVYLALVSGYLPTRTECHARLTYDRATRTAIAEPDETKPPTQSIGSKGSPQKHRKFATARTKFYPLAFSGDRSVGVVAAVPETGRTHQIRCHAASIGIPLFNDMKYGGPADDDLESFILHTVLFATQTPQRSWIASLPGPVYGYLRTTFGDLAGIERRLNEIVPSACTGLPGRATIRI